MPLPWCAPFTSSCFLFSAAGDDEPVSSGKRGSRFARTFGAIRNYAVNKVARGVERLNTVAATARLSQAELIDYSRLLVDCLESSQVVGKWLQCALRADAAAATDSAPAGASTAASAGVPAAAAASAASPPSSARAGATNDRRHTTRKRAVNPYTAEFAASPAGRALFGDVERLRACASLYTSSASSFAAIAAFYQDVVCGLLLFDVGLLAKRYIRKSALALVP